MFNVKACKNSMIDITLKKIINLTIEKLITGIFTTKFKKKSYLTKVQNISFITFFAYETHMKLSCWEKSEPSADHDVFMNIIPQETIFLVHSNFPSY